MNLSEKNIREKSQTIKIDIRSMGYAHTSFSSKGTRRVKMDYFSQLDPHFFFEHSYDAIVLIDTEGKVLDTNERAVQFFGFKENSEILGASLRTLIAGVTDSLLEQVRSVVTEEQRYMRIQAFAHHTDNSYSAVEIIVLGSGRKDLSGKEPICYLIRDTQSRWEAEQNLLSAYHAMDNTDAGIGIAGLDGKFIYANRALTALLADAGERVTGQPLQHWFDTKAVIQPMRENILKKLPWSGEQRLLRGEKSAWLLISAVPDLDQDNELTGIVLSVRDLAERRRAELAEQRVERNRMIMESLSSVCHSLGQPATVLLTSIELLRQKDIDEETRDQMLEMSYGAILELRQYLQQLNDKRHYEDEEGRKEK